jgi:hypothetical protein
MGPTRGTERTAQDGPPPRPDPVRRRILGHTQRIVTVERARNARRRESLHGDVIRRLWRTTAASTGTGEARVKSTNCGGVPEMAAGRAFFPGASRRATPGAGGTDPRAVSFLDTRSAHYHAHRTPSSTTSVRHRSDRPERPSASLGAGRADEPGPSAHRQQFMEGLISKRGHEPRPAISQPLHRFQGSMGRGGCGQGTVTSSCG